MVEVNRDSHYLITHFTPENTPHMSRLHIGNSREGNKRFKNEQFERTLFFKWALSLKQSIFCHSLENKSGSELKFTPENTPHMSRLHIGNSRKGNKRRIK